VNALQGRAKFTRRYVSLSSKTSFEAKPDKSFALLPASTQLNHISAKFQGSFISSQLVCEISTGARLHGDLLSRHSRLAVIAPTEVSPSVHT
jgi:hypothetical protein